MLSGDCSVGRHASVGRRSRRCRDTLEGSIQKSTNYSWEEPPANRHSSFEHRTQQRKGRKGPSQTHLLRLEQLQQRISNNQIRCIAKIEPLERNLGGLEKQHQHLEQTEQAAEANVTRDLEALDRLFQQEVKTRNEQRQQLLLDQLSEFKIATKKSSEELRELHRQHTKRLEIQVQAVKDKVGNAKEEISHQQIHHPAVRETLLNELAIEIERIGRCIEEERLEADRQASEVRDLIDSMEEECLAGLRSECLQREKAEQALTNALETAFQKVEQQLRRRGC